MLFLIIIGFFLIGLFNVFEEWAFSWPFREIDFSDSKEDSKGIKKKLQSVYHWNGLYSIITKATLISCTSFFIYHEPILKIGHFFMYWLAAMLTYWNVFNIGLALKIHRDWWYIGVNNEPHWLVETFGPKTGKYVTFVSAGLLALIIIFD